MPKINKILWFSWKDRRHPLAGGSELVNEEIAKRLVRDGCEVVFLVGGFKGGKSEEEVDGFKIIRLGSRWTVYWWAYKYYKRNLQDWADLVIDEMNTIPFFCKFFVKEKNIMFVHQLCRQIWFYQIYFPFNVLGYFLEPIYLWLLRDRKVITVSESTKRDLMKYGFQGKNINIISEGIDIKSVEDLEEIDKYSRPMVLSFGAVRAMKRTDQIVKAFELAQKEVPNLQLVIAGDASDKYGQRVLKMIACSPSRESIKYLGRIDQVGKAKLMQRCYLICVTSVKEGWGLIVAEANSQGTPAVVYDVDGLRDSVRDGVTGLICQENKPKDLATNVIRLLRSQEKYQNFRKNAWQWSKQINFEKSYADFRKAVAGL